MRKKTLGYSSVQKINFTMPPTAGKNKKSFKKIAEKYLTLDFLKSLFVNPDYLPFVAVHILIFELFINLFVINKVAYTEIDWKAYMQECEGFLNGTFDYSELRGDTGPLVYPAGFVYIYSAFYFLTNHGENVRLAQYAFLVIYLLQLCCVLRIHWKTSKVPPYVLVISILTSYRIHSIYVLRLFNDPIAILLFFISLNLFLDSKWTMGSLFYSLAVSVKMNILLFAPALLMFYLANLTMYNTIFQLFICAVLQLFLGAPFLIGNPIAYLKGSFDLGRVFEHKWTVNYRFLDVELFESKFFHLLLLSLHILLLLVFFPTTKKYFNSYVKLKYVETQIQPQIDAKNRENRVKRKVSKITQKKSALKQRHPNTVEEKTDVDRKEDDEILSPDQEEFLKSFESSMKKAGGSGKAAEKSTPKVTFEEPVYNVNFKRTNQLFILPMFLANFIGVVCARSLHYQFYSWYFHTLPYLLWSTPFSNVLRFLILALIEFSWNTYPSTVFSSSLLHACHLLVLWGVYSNTKVR